VKLRCINLKAKG